MKTLQNIFLDTEFVEVPEKGLMVPISIGLVTEEGDEYYAVNAEMDREIVLADEWVVANVVAKLPDESDPAWQNLTTIRRGILGFLKQHQAKFIQIWGKHVSPSDAIVLQALVGGFIALFRGDLEPSAVDFKDMHILKRAFEDVQAGGAMDPALIHIALEDARNERQKYAAYERLANTGKISKARFDALTLPAEMLSL